MLAKDYLRALRVRRPAAVALAKLLSQVMRSLRRLCRHCVAARRLLRMGPNYPAEPDISGAANLCGCPSSSHEWYGRSGAADHPATTGGPLGEAALLAIGMAYHERTNFTGSGRRDCDSRLAHVISGNPFP